MVEMQRGRRRKLNVFLALSAGVLSLLLDAGTLSAAVFANFSPARHERFLVGDPADPDPLNPTFLLDHTKITGVGLSAAVLVTPQHFLTATHVGVLDPTFVSADGVRHTYGALSRTVLQTTLTSDLTLSNGTVLPAGSVHASDLSLVRLASPISADDGIAPMALFGGSLSSIVGRDVNLFVQSNRAGSDTANFVQQIELNTGAITDGVAYRYDNPPGLPASDELRFSGGDSGRASVTQINGQYVVVGTHMGIGTDSNTGDFYSIDNYVVPYLEQIQAVVALDGYQINVVAVPEPGSTGLMGLVVVLAVIVVKQRTALVMRKRE
tara:strand:- start:599 stop:1567 length:969 start_codon:yes stop_codon:yes gene_type:complete